MGEIVTRVQKHRAKLRSEGMRPIQILVPDTRREGFAEECMRQSALLNNDPHEVEIMQFLNEAADREGWTA
ncbi:MAG: antitoxin MazE family protein [Chlorobiaceae bacterium]